MSLFKNENKRGVIVVIILLLAVIGLFALSRSNADAATPPCLHGDGAVTGTAGDDHLCGGNQQDTIRGLGGDDVLAGNHAPDIVLGGPGNDVLWGGKGPDTLNGGPGYDICHNSASTGADTIKNCEDVRT